MQKQLLTFALLSAAAVPFLAVADTWDKKTTLTVNEPILVPGKELPPGKYVMKLANVTANRNVVQIFNENEDQLQATILAFPNRRVNAQDSGAETVLTYWETPAGSPPALRAWFFPGDDVGQEFAYPREMAERIAQANNNAQVASYEGGALTADQANEIAVNGRREDAATPQSAAPTTTAANPRPAEENVLLAQNQPAPQPQIPAEQPAAPPAPAADQAQTDAPATTALNEDPSELPRTASPVPWVMMGGLAALVGALLMRRIAA